MIMTTIVPSFLFGHKKSANTADFNNTKKIHLYDHSHHIIYTLKYKQPMVIKYRLKQSTSEHKTLNRHYYLLRISTFKSIAINNCHCNIICPFDNI